MGKEKRSNGKSIFNLFDIIVIVIIVALAILLFFIREERTAQESTSAGTVTYTLELVGMQNGAADLIGEGDQLVDKVKKYNIGTVVSVEVMPTYRQVYDYVNGGLVESLVDDQQTAIIVVEAECTESSSQITVDGGYVIRAGLTASVRGPGYWGTGYIMSVDRGEAAQ